jgi:hypothetical protein
MKHLTLSFVSVKPVRTTTIGPIRLSSDDYKKKWLSKIERLGTRQN